MLTTTQSVIQYAGNGVTTAFAYPYYFLENAHIAVLRTVAGVDSVPVNGVDYNVTGEKIPAGGTVTFVTPPAVGDTITIYRDIPITQLVDYVVDDNFPAETHEQALDKITMILQYLASVLARTPRGSLSGPAIDPLAGFGQISGIAACINGEEKTLTLLGKIEN